MCRHPAVTPLALPTGSTPILIALLHSPASNCFEFLQDARTGEVWCARLSKDQLSQHHPAEISAASAKDSQGSLRPSDYLHKHAMAQPCPAHVESSTPKNPPHPPLVSQASIASPETGNPATDSTSPQLPAVHNLTERSLAHEEALRRLQGLDSQQKRGKKAPDAASTASTQPVLVREYSQNSPAPSIRQSRMRKHRNSSVNRDSSALPSIESFSFQDILASIDPEVHGSIDRIAEICGRSKMSLADEYSSHLPPQADFSLLGLAEQAGISRLEPVEEASSTHEDTHQDPRPTRSRAARLSLVGNSNHARGELSSAPVNATSAVASSPQPSDVQETSGRPEGQSAYIPQLLAWLRSSRDDPHQSSRTSKRNSGAAAALQRILGSSADTTTSH